MSLLFIAKLLFEHITNRTGPSISIIQQPKTYPHPRVSAARPPFAFSCCSALSSTVILSTAPPSREKYESVSYGAQPEQDRAEHPHPCLHTFVNVGL